MRHVIRSSRASQVGDPGEADTNVACAGMVWVRDTLDASEGPVFVMLIVYVIGEVTVEVSGATTIKDKSVSRTIEVVSVTLLLFSFGSIGEVIEAVLLRVPDALFLTDPFALI